jgi:hypothetical protein
MEEALTEVGDPRCAYGNLRHRLEDVIIIGLLSTICLGEDFSDMEEFGKEREAWLRDFLELPSGIPDSGTFRDIFERVVPDELSKCLNDWIEKKRDGNRNINDFAYAVRKHLSIENQVRGHLEDSASARKDKGNSSLNMDVLRKTAFLLFRTDLGRKRPGDRKRMFRAPLSQDVLEKILFAQKSGGR